MQKLLATLASELTGKVEKLWGVGLLSLPAGRQEGGDMLKEHFLEFRNLEHQRIRHGGEDSEVVIEMQREKEKPMIQQVHRALAMVQPCRL